MRSTALRVKNEEIEVGGTKGPLWPLAELGLGLLLLLLLLRHKPSPLSPAGSSALSVLSHREGAVVLASRKVGQSSFPVRQG